jgi:hypothetical protein
MGFEKNIWAVALIAVLGASAHPANAQDAKQIVQQAVNAELAAARNDNSHWRYVESEMDRSQYVVVETEHGAIRRHIEEYGRPASAATLAADNESIQKFIHDPGMQQKQRQNGAHDDKSAAELTNLLAEAFVWRVESETADTITLHYAPDPSFHPPDMEARVMGDMAGTLIVDRTQHRIRTFKGALQSDVTIGFGFLARLKQGGTFDIERRQLAPGVWQITESHVHIDGRALFFHSIGEQQDEVKWDFTPVPPGTTLEQALSLLAEPAKPTATQAKLRR